MNINGLKQRLDDGAQTAFQPAEMPFASPARNSGQRGPLVEEGEFTLLAEVQTLYHAKRALKRICEMNAIDAFALLKMKSDGPNLTVEMITSSWSDDPSDKLKKIAEEDPKIRTKLLDGVVPFHIALDPRHQPARLTSVCLPVYCERARGAILLQVDGTDRDEAAFRQIHLYALYLFANLTALMKPRSTLTPLAPRETECLRWSAAGKTSSEIAGIIGVSENTVNSYLSSAAQKMNAVNRVQTVAQAIRLGLLS